MGQYYKPKIWHYRLSYKIYGKIGCSISHAGYSNTVDFARFLFWRYLR
jgi:hypothetical protein